jgi:carotenoid cleavage dioxygenase-like enzyme
MLGGGAAPLAAVLAACSREGAAPRAPLNTSTSTPPPSTTAPTTTTSPPSTAPVDPSQPWWMQGNYAPVADELTVTELEVRGALPPELAGLYVRNGSNPANGPSGHWFFGDGMVHGVRLNGGKAEWYRNRFVQTEPLRSGAGFGQGPPGGASNQSNVSTIWHGGSLLTSGEVGFPYQLSPDDLSTIGVRDYDGALTGAFTAHPKIDPVTGRMHAFGYGFSEPYLQYYVIEPDGTMSSAEPVPMARSVMIHDFAITETDAVFWDLPVLFDIDLAIKFVQDPVNGPMPFAWRPETGGRVGVMPLAGGAGQIKWFDIDPCYVFHGVNAFRRGDEVVVDVCRLSSAFADDDMVTSEGSLRRWTLNTATGALTDDVIDTENPGDLPSRDPRLVGRDYRHAYLVGVRDNPDTVEFGGLIKHDYRTGTRTFWEPGPDRHAGEPLFVPDAGDTADDAGWLLTFVHDEAVNESTLAVLDASDVAAGPVAEVVMPRRVPYGFHASWIADQPAE